jgi:hypothetical protein
MRSPTRKGKRVHGGRPTTTRHQLKRRKVDNAELRRKMAKADDEQPQLQGRKVDNEEPQRKTEES